MYCVFLLHCQTLSIYIHGTLPLLYILTTYKCQTKYRNVYSYSITRIIIKSQNDDRRRTNENGVAKDAKKG